MNRYAIRLIRTPDHSKPDADPNCGYAFEAPLDGDSELDLAGWREDPDGFPVKRFWTGEEDLHGRLVNKGNRLWYFHYNLHEEPDEFAYQFDRDIFRQGEYVSMRDHGGEMHMFRIVSVTEI